MIFSKCSDFRYYRLNKRQKKSWSCCISCIKPTDQWSTERYRGGTFRINGSKSTSSVSVLIPTAWTVYQNKFTEFNWIIMLHYGFRNTTSSWNLRKKLLERAICRSLDSTYRHFLYSASNQTPYHLLSLCIKSY